MNHEVTSATEPFWEALGEGVFRVPQCNHCGDAFFPPAPLCPNCGGQTIEWILADEGALYSFTRQHRTAPGFEAPLVMGIVELEVGPRLLAPIDANYDALSIGQSVRLMPREYMYEYNRMHHADRPFFEAVPLNERDTDD